MRSARRVFLLTAIYLSLQLFGGCNKSVREPKVSTVDRQNSAVEPSEPRTTTSDEPQEAITLFQQVLNDGDQEILAETPYSDLKGFSASERDKFADFEKNISPQSSIMLENVSATLPEIDSLGTKDSFEGRQMNFILEEDENIKLDFKR